MQTLNKAKPTPEGSAIVRHTGSILKGTANRELYKYFENGMKELEVILDKSEKFLKVGCFGRKLGEVKISSIGIKAFEKYNIIKIKATTNNNEESAKVIKPTFLKAGALGFTLLQSAHKPKTIAETVKHQPISIKRPKPKIA